MQKIYLFYKFEKQLIARFKAKYMVWLVLAEAKAVVFWLKGLEKKTNAT
jgi:hypothetical protein